MRFNKGLSQLPRIVMDVRCRCVFVHPRSNCLKSIQPKRGFTLYAILTWDYSQTTELKLESSANTKTPPKTTWIRIWFHRKTSIFTTALPILKKKKTISASLTFPRMRRASGVTVNRSRAPDAIIPPALRARVRIAVRYAVGPSWHGAGCRPRRRRRRRGRRQRRRYAALVGAQLALRLALAVQRHAYRVPIVHQILTLDST